ncbi:MAG: neutral zinc metallopeptidase [Actinomycetales bacterium]
MSFNEGVTIDSSGASRGGGGGRRGGGPVMVGGGIGTLIIVIIALMLGVDPSAVLSGAQPDQGQTVNDQALAQQCQTGADANTNVDCRVVATYDSANTYWGPVVQQAGITYTQPSLILFNQQVSTGCGAATSQVGPFYCPTDQTIYIDTSFFDVLEQQFGSSGGPLAQEYVIAHEFGHHIENLQGVLGYSQQDPSGPESGAVRIELMADCYGGVWAHNAVNTIDPDTGQTFLKPLTDQDIADALSAAASVGDDRIQQKTQGRVTPEGWTHGSAQMRQHWFTVGYSTGDPSQCNTLQASDLDG